ncbi:MAG: flagellar export chaperone FliS [Deltaproteobacteria bacterium CG23_combo_of_CG06-09_8_20_14_all_60_8]|nr:MAG: flagellar export chaperone FliS [Desulfobacterales bacterium CG2_30_60_27]PIP43780.1 MAG: flagellar export chaperone FliS [Deltaproteobacteria bacterium CG23_combo_of_CG06-09_8_20_14_all_60_8]
MVMHQASKAYFQAQASVKIAPVKLIQMLYERLLIHLDCAAEGLLENDPKKRGEHLSKAIAIITELNCSIRMEDKSEPARFLRGMYEAMLIALGTVPVVQDVEVIRLARRYVQRLKTIWEETAMLENGFGGGERRPVRQPGDAVVQAAMEQIGKPAKAGTADLKVCLMA